MVLRGGAGAGQGRPVHARPEQPAGAAIGEALGQPHRRGRRTRGKARRHRLRSAQASRGAARKRGEEGPGAEKNGGGASSRPREGEDKKKKKGSSWERQWGQVRSGWHRIFSPQMNSSACVYTRVPMCGCVQVRVSNSHPICLLCISSDISPAVDLLQNVCARQPQSTISSACVCGCSSARVSECDSASVSVCAGVSTHPSTG